MAGRSSGPRPTRNPTHTSRRKSSLPVATLKAAYAAAVAAPAASPYSATSIARQLATYPEGVRWPAGPRWLAAAPVGQACPTLRISSPTIVEYERPCIAPASEPVLLARVRDHRDAVGSRFAGGVFDALHRFEWDRGHEAVALDNPPPYSPGRRTGKLGSRLQTYREKFKPLLTGS